MPQQNSDAERTEAVPGSHPDWQSRLSRGKAHHARAPQEELQGGIAALAACSNNVSNGSNRAPALRAGHQYARQTARNLLVPEPLQPGAASLEAALKEELASLGHKRMVPQPRRPQHGTGRRAVTVPGVNPGGSGEKRHFPATQRIGSGEAKAYHLARAQNNARARTVSSEATLESTLPRKVHVSPQTYRCTGAAGERALQPFAPEPAPLPRAERRGAGERWCYGLKLGGSQEPTRRSRQRPLNLCTANVMQAGRSGGQRTQRRRSISAPAPAAAARCEPCPESDAQPEPSEPPAAASAEVGDEAAPAPDANAQPSRFIRSVTTEPAAEAQREPETSGPQPQRPAVFPPPVHPASARPVERSSEEYSALRRSAPAGSLPRPSRLSKRSSASGGKGSSGSTASQEMTWLPGLMTAAASPDVPRHNRPDPALMAAYRPHPLKTARSMPAERDFVLSWSLPGL